MRKNKIEQVAEAWNAGKSIEEISSEFGIKESTVYQYLSKARLKGIIIREKETRIEQVDKALNAGKSIEEISSELGLKESTVKHYLSEARSQGIEVKKRENKEARIKQVAGKWNDGEHVKEIPTEEKKEPKNDVQSDERKTVSKSDEDLNTKIINELEKRLPRDCAKILNIEPRIVYDLLDSLSSQEKNSLKRLFIQSKKKVYKKIVRLKKEGFTSGEALFKLEYSLENDLKPDLAEIYFILGNGDRALNVLNGIIYDEDANETIRKRAKEKKDEIELELKSMEIRREYKTQKNMDGSEITYDDLCRRYKVRTSFIVQLLGKRERDY